MSDEEVSKIKEYRYLSALVPLVKCNHESFKTIAKLVCLNENKDHQEINLVTQRYILQAYPMWYPESLASILQWSRDLEPFRDHLLSTIKSSADIELLINSRGANDKLKKEILLKDNQPKWLATFAIRSRQIKHMELARHLIETELKKSIAAKDLDKILELLCVVELFSKATESEMAQDYT